jgi:hypothetical protein
LKRLLKFCVVTDATSVECKAICEHGAATQILRGKQTGTEKEMKFL